jgi:HD-GYP domain-containing protein (c-di-GMP phosphodiesterase class II)
VEAAIVEIVRLSGIHFDPEVIEAFEATIAAEPVEIAALPAA